MINLMAAQLLSLPTGAKSDVAPKLPWPNGSLITAKLTAGDAEGSVILSLGGYRMRTQVPPNTPMGQVWLLLLSREMPAQFRLLSDAHAARFLADTLAKKAEKLPLPTTDKASVQGVQQAWHKVEAEQMPFAAHVSANGQYVMLEDGEGRARGMVQKQAVQDGFLLHGRVDLEQLGAVVFALRGEANQWTLKVYSDSGQSVHILRHDFSDWLKEQPLQVFHGDVRVQLDGQVDYGFPDDFSFLSGVEI